MNPLDLYAQDEESEQLEIAEEEDGEEGVNAGYNFDMDDIDDVAEDEVEQQMDPEELRRKENDILFAIQGVGRIKNINGYEVYVKNKQCEASLRDIHKYLKHESMI